MKVKVFDWFTEIFPDDNEIKELCNIGQGADTCVWLIVSGRGFECTYHNKPFYLVERWLRGETTAKRDGCDKVKDWNKLVEGVSHDNG